MRVGFGWSFFNICCSIFYYFRVHEEHGIWDMNEKFFIKSENLVSELFRTLNRSGIDQIERKNGAFEISNIFKISWVGSVVTHEGCNSPAQRENLLKIMDFLQTLNAPFFCSNWSIEEWLSVLKSSGTKVFDFMKNFSCISHIPCSSWTRK